MGELTRTTRAAETERTRLIFVRQPIKSVRRGEHGDPLPLRLAVGIIAALGGITLLWLLGFLGFHLGFTPLLGAPGMELAAGSGLIAGILLLLSLPGAVLHAAMIEPLWLLVGFLLISIPAGGLAAAKPGSPGGPRPHVLTVVFSITGAIAAALAAIGLIWWTASPLRRGLLGPIPMGATEIESWLSAVRLAAAMDVMAVIVAGLWVVLILRMPVALWLRVLAALAAFAALIIALTAMASSAGALSQVLTPRPLEERGLIVGELSRRAVILHAGEPGSVRLALIQRPENSTLQGSESIHDFIRRHRTEP